MATPNQGYNQGHNQGYNQGYNQGRAQASCFDAGKPRFDLIDPIAMRGLADALTFGANKYGDHNWRAGMPFSKVLASLQRHLNAFASGEKFDAESGLSHLSHLQANAMFLANYEVEKPEMNDLYPTVGFLPCEIYSPQWTRVYATDEDYFNRTREYMHRYHPHVAYSLIERRR